MEKTCKGYCGIACVDGSCPKASLERYVEPGSDCDKCILNRGCVDCCFFATRYCVNFEEQQKKLLEQLKN